MVTGQPGTLPCGAVYRPVNGTNGTSSSPGSNALFDVFTQIPELDFKSKSRTFYAQDEWRPFERLTAKLGLRYDSQAFKRDDGSNAATLTKYQPRIGFAYDVFNNANTVVHGHWGRFMDDNALTLSSYLASSAAVQTRYAWSNSLQRFLYQLQAGGASGNLLDPSLKPTYADETNFGITQRLTKDSSLDVTGIWKQSHDIFEDSCVNGTCTAPEFRFWMTNNPAGQTNVLKQKYDGVVLSNVSSLKLTRPQMTQIRDYVRDYGGGLMMVGGEESFGLGGYYRTPIEEALPVTMEVKQ